MKKILGILLFLLGINTFSQAEEIVNTTSNSMTAKEEKEAMKILDRIRDKISKEEKARIEEEKRAEKERVEAVRKAEEERVAQERAIQEEQERQLKAEAEAIKNEELGRIPVSENEKADKINKIIKDKRKAEKKPKVRTAFQKMELTKNEALEKLDFYERVVRSVAREEKEIKDYIDITEGK